MNNKHLSWNKEINNNFIIASRAYFLHSPQLNLNTLLLDLAALSFCGWSKHSRTMAFIWSKCHLLWQRKRHQDCQQPSSALKDKAHWNSPSLSQRSCCEGRCWYHTRQHWRAIGKYLHQALGWEEILQVTVWAKYLGILKCPVIGHTS